MKIKKFNLVLLIILLFFVLLISLYLWGLIHSKSDCSSYTIEKCPQRCVVCPPCEACSSITCQTEEFCNKMGFDRSWYETIKKRLQEYKQ